MSLVCWCQCFRIYCVLDAPVFGVTMEMAIQRSQIAADGIELPTVFRECIDFLEENGEWVWSC